MLRISGPGWAEVSIDGKVVYEGSYLTNMPCDFMKALYDYFNDYDNEDKRISSSVYVDCEGGVANFVFSDMCFSGNNPKVFMFYQAKTKTGWEIQAFDVDPYYLAIELINDIETDFENWVNWISWDVNGIESIRSNLNYWLNKLKNIMKDKKSYEEEFKDWNTPGTKEYDKVEKIKKQAIELLENNKDAIPYGHIEKHLPKNN